MKLDFNPVKAFLIWLVRGYQILISPLLPRSCKYYPSCSQYAVDALTQHGVVRGTVLAGWRLLRCNPWSYGGYDPVEHQTLFGKGRSGAPRSRRHDPGSRVIRGKALSLVLALILAAVLLAMPMALTSCGFFGSTETTAAATTTVAGATTVPGEATTTTTLAAEQNPGSFDKTTKPLQALFFAVLDFFYDKLHVSWSWAIVLLTVVVRIVLIPLTWRQIKSMRAMQALQPELKALQEKYKDDRQILNQKVMEFYRENKVSPFGSCLPLLLQMPVFLGLFYMLRTAGRPDLDPAEWGRWASIFVDPQVGWLWIKDITTFDIGLLFLYVASQFLASWQMARKGAGQQKVISYMMPIVVGIFMFVYKWPAGLFIYWFTSNLWTIAQQFVLEKVVPAPVAVTAGSAKGTAAARVPGETPAGPSGKAAGKASEKAGGKAAGKAPTKASGKAPTKASAKTPAKSPGQSGASPKKKTTPAQPAAKTPATPSGKSGGKTSGQQAGKQGKAAGSTSQRTDGGNGGSKGFGGT
ncbi:MAG: membrane protein insertion efficiency factor YidD [Thermoleophilia bacterium]|nr:membrane protein insertion efficiency factor YidD [Thermoleophilia bacterium]